MMFIEWVSFWLGFGIGLIVAGGIFALVLVGYWAGKGEKKDG